MEIDKDSPHTLIFYESPYRIEDCLTDALEVFGDRSAALACELTKMFEKIERGTLSSLLASVRQAKLRGEYVLVIAGTSKNVKSTGEETM
jgi:16S rRNA (cytidine1402-2'-O)-methyltransferase